jgi:rhamnosyltransferase
MKRLAIYMLHDESGQVADYVTFKLKKLRPHIAKLIVVCNSNLTPEGRAALETVADLVHVRKNVGFDVWAYREGLIELVGWKELGEYDELLLLNYTFYAPIFPFEEMFAKADAQDVDFWGITAFKGPVPNDFTGVGELPFHIQSHFIAIRRRLFTTQAFRNYWERMPPIKSYVDSILQHETRFTEHFAKQGFRYFVYCDPKKYSVVHPAFDMVDVLLADRCPILKRRPFFHEPEYLDQNAIDLHRALEILKARSDYDPSLIWRDITRASKPRTLYTNATLLEILPTHGEPVPLRPEVKIAVLAHIYYPSMVDEMLDFAESIPVPFDLFVTTSDQERKEAIARAISARPPGTLRLKKLKVVSNHGRDVSALLIGLREVVLNGGYDYLCRIHSKKTPQDAFGVARHFKEHLFENLLANRAYVSHLLALMEREPRVGVVMPPTIHIGYPTLGNAWFDNRPGVEAWAKKLGVKVPFDDDTPLATYGSMYWFRPLALAPLFKYAFKYEDFPTDWGDGRLPHILERLVVYTAHSQGYYAKCVLSPANAAKNYVKLEYKAQKQVAEGNRLRALLVGGAPVVFPKQQLKQYVNHRLASRPATLKLVRGLFVATRATYRFAKRLSQKRRG